MLDACAYFDTWLAFRRASIGSPASRPPCCTTATSSWRRPTGSPTSTAGTALTTDHRFRIASHSKTFTATAVVRLAERGVLRLDDTVGQWLPAVAAGAGSPG